MSKSCHIFVHWVLSKKRMSHSKTKLWNALSLVIHNICKFKNFQHLLEFRFGLLIQKKNIQNYIIIVFHLMYLTNSSLHPEGFNIGSQLLFYDRCKNIKWPFLFPVSSNATKICIWRFYLCWKWFPLQITDSFSFHSKLELRKIEAAMCIIAKLAFNTVSLWGWKN